MRAEPAPGPIGPPPTALLLSEGRALWELGAYFCCLPWLQGAPRGDGHPVLVLPGLLLGDLHMTPLASFLRGRGYAVHGWAAGINRGRWTLLDEHLVPLLARLVGDHGRKVSLVGLSLGGMFARELAKRCPDRVRGVVTLGSGFAGRHPRANNAWPIYQLVSGHRPSSIQRHGLLDEPPTVPSTSIFSRLDGMVHWRTCLQARTPRSENVEVVSSHHGMAHHPAALLAIADRLAQPEGRWRPFAPPAWGGLAYPDPYRP